MKVICSLFRELVFKKRECVIVWMVFFLSLAFLYQDVSEKGTPKLETAILLAVSIFWVSISTRDFIRDKPWLKKPT